MPKNKLFDDDDDEADEVSFKSQGEYAKRYDQWREKEELHKLEQKYEGKDLDSNASSSSDSEDEEPAEMTEEMEEQFLKTLALLKTKDPRIYDPKYKFFKGEAVEEKEQKQEKTEEKPKPKKEVNSLAAAFAESDDEDDNGQEIFKVEKKAPELKPMKQEKLKDFLTGKEAHLDEGTERELAPLRALWSDPHLNEGEAFLRDYILNKRYAEPAFVAPEKLLDDAALELDEQLVDEQGKFERAYNFRFEEPDQEYLKRYPRTMSSVRPKDDRRAKKRGETRSRKDEEKHRKMEEIARLKALKLKEIQKKIARIKEVTGNEELAFKDEDIEGDFDPEDHDRRMRAIFDEQYYGDADQEKPVFPDLDEELEIENWENFDHEEVEDKVQNAGGPHCEDEDFNMDADYDPKRARTTLMEEIKETLGNKRRNRKKKSKLASILASKKPTYVPAAESTYAQHMEEYYKMDCEDVIAGDLPTRFKYRDTVPNDFGLTIEEILLADDKELNAWASLKKTVKYRPESVEKGEVANYRQKAANPALKRRLLPSLFKDIPEEPEIVVPVDTSKKKKKKKAKSNTPAAVNTGMDAVNANTSDAVDTSTGAVNTDSADQVEPNGVDVNEENQEAEPRTSEVIVSVKKNKRKPKKSDINTELSNSIEKPSKSREDVESSSATIELDKKTEVSGDISLNNSSTEGKKKARRRKQKKQQLDGFTLENVKTANPGQNIDKQNGEHGAVSVSAENSKKNQSKDDPKSMVNLKRKLDASETNNDEKPTMKKKKKNKQNKNNLQNGFKNNKFNKKDNSKKTNNKNESENPLSKLTDERLKAYGLNPKKYRSFLKYKKF